MRILQIAPAGVEVSVDSTQPVGAALYWLVEGLIDRGHQVTLWAAPSSRTRARVKSIGRHVPPADAPLRERTIYERLHAFAAASDRDAYEVVHNHAGEAAGELLGQFATPAVSTLYEPLLARGAKLRYRGGLIASSWNQLYALDDASRGQVAGVVYPWLPVEELPFSDEPGGCLLYAAPIAPQFGAHTALAVARRLELPLRIAGHIAPAYRGYWQTEVAPQVDGDAVRYLGPLSPPALAAEAAGAVALIHPVSADLLLDWGAIAALVAGTPVLSMRRGAMAEFVTHGETGFLVDEPWQFTGAADQVDRLSRRACRRRARALFNIERAVDQIQGIYESLITGRPVRQPVSPLHPELEALDPRPVLEVA